MKTKQNILLILMLCCSIGGWAKEYVKLPVETIVHCEDAGLPYIWRDHELEKNGTYRDTVYMADPDMKDTIYTVKFSLAQRTTRTINFQIREGNCAEWRKKKYCTAGTFIDTIKSEDNNCDTIETINVAMVASYHFYEQVHSCGDTAFWWHGKYVDEAKEYRADYKTKDGVDSIYHLSVVFEKPSQEFKETRYGCKKKVPYIWEDVQLWKDTTVTRTLKSRYGCDSIVEMTLKLLDLPTPTTKFTTEFCAADGYYTHGIITHREVVYRDTLPSFCGCDSVIEYTYKPYAGSFFNETFGQFLKEKPGKPGTVFHWRGKDYNQAGIYRDTVPGGPDAHGCYSVYQLQLYEQYETEDARTVCEGTKVEIKVKGNKTLIVTSDYNNIDSLKSRFGTDSVIHRQIVFTPKQVFTFPDTLFICGNETYTWTYDNKSLVISGQDYHNGTTIKYVNAEINLGNCRKAVRVVGIVPYHIKDSLVIMCNEDVKVNPFIWKDHRGRTYIFGQEDQDITILDTLNSPITHKPGEPATLNDCPDILRFRFISTKTCSPVDTFHICDGDSIYIDRKWYKNQGLYQNIMSSITYKQRGLLDSVHNFRIIAAAVDTAEYTINRCDSDEPTMYAGKLYTEQTIDTLHLKYSGQSCDSLILIVHVNTKPKRIAPVIQKDFCSNKEIWVPTPTGKVLTTPGYHTDTIYSPYDMGCDSILQYYIYTHEATDIVDTIWLRPGQTYKWTYHGRDSLITQPGMYVDSTKVGQYNCDSIRTLIVNLNDPYYELTTDFGCANALPYQWRGKNFYNDTTVKDTIYAYQKDSIFELRLTVAPIYDSIRHVALLPGKTYNFYGHVLTLKDTIAVKFKTFKSKVTGCDSTERLQIVPVQPVIIDTVLCPGQSIERPDIVNDQYADTIPNNGSWSITIHQIIHDKKVISVIPKQIKHGESYLWKRCKGDTLLTRTGEYLDTCVKANGCDSIIKLKLIVGDDKLFSEQDSACANDLPFEWHGQWLDTTGIYYDRKKTTLGYDSVYMLDFKVIDIPHIYKTIDTCYDGVTPIRLYEYNITTDTTFQRTFISQSLCDSVVHFRVNIHFPYKSTKAVVLKPGQSITWRGRVIKHEDLTGEQTFYDQTPSPYGCDSVFMLTVYKCPNPVTTNINKTLCEGDVFYVNGQRVTSNGTYREYLTTSMGCDSIVAYNVVILRTEHNDTTVLLYPRDTVKWRGQKYYRAGVYSDTLHYTNQRCDSVVYRLFLTAVTPGRRDTTILVCDGRYTYRDIEYYKDSTFIDTIANRFGKDSVYWHKHFHLSDHCSDYDQYYLCPNEPRYIEQVWVDHIGEYRKVVPISQTEDSVYRFMVSNPVVYTIPIFKEGCDSVEWGGEWYKARGTDDPFVVRVPHTSVQYGCDSTEILTLTIHTTKKQIEKRTIADIQIPYEFNGRTYYTSKVDTFTYKTSPCDSLFIFQLTVLPTKKDTVIKYYCKGDPQGVEVFGKIIYPTQDMVKDSLVHESGIMVNRTYIIYVNQPFTIAQFDDQRESQVCAANALTFYVKYTVTDPNAGNLPTHYDVDFSVGNLDAHPKSATYETKGKTTLPIYMDGLGTCVQPGYYSYQIRFRSAGCPISDTTLTGNVLVRYPASIMEANWHNVVALVNENYNAGHWTLLPPYAWQVWDYNHNEKTNMVNPSDKTQPYIASDNLRENDIVIATLYREGYALPVPSCPFVFKPVNYVGSSAVTIYPTAVRARTMVHVQSEVSGEYQIYSSTGNKCAQGSITDGDNTVQVPGSVGCYIMKVALQDGSSAIEQLIVY